MGHFFACSGFRETEPDKLASLVASYIAGFGCPAKVIKPRLKIFRPNPNPQFDAMVFGEFQGWTIIIWPDYFCIHDIPVCTKLAEQLKTLVSTVHCHDGDYWTHVLIENGRILDRFGSIPDYFPKEESEVERLKKNWAGNPALLSEHFNVEIGVIEPYLRHIKLTDESHGKVYPDDEFELDNWWVFTDFWRRLGINYPNDVSAFKLIVRLCPDFMRRLPLEDEL